jgi:hypothetical protein
MILGARMTPRRVAVLPAGRTGRSPVHARMLEFAAMVPPVRPRIQPSAVPGARGGARAAGAGKPTKTIKTT